MMHWADADSRPVYIHRLKSQHTIYKPILSPSVGLILQLSQIKSNDDHRHHLRTKHLTLRYVINIKKAQVEMPSDFLNVLQVLF